MVPMGIDKGLVGRQSELDILANALGEAQSGNRRVVLIEGEAGIGKSRMIGEIRRLATDSGMLVLDGAADSIEKHTPYRTWRGILHGLFGLTRDEDPAEQGRHVFKHVTQIDQSYADRIGLLQDILDLEFPEAAAIKRYTPEVRKESLAMLVGELLGVKALTGTVVLILEDAHWLDSVSWELLLSVAQSLVHRPALLLVTCQPLDDPALEIASLLELSGAERLLLEPLNIKDTVALASQQLGVKSSALPESVWTLISERAQGNPLFAIELAGALVDHGLLTIEDGICHLLSEEDNLAALIPDTIQGVIRSRQDQLSEGQKLTLKAASVLGKNFSLETLKAVHPGQIDEDELRTHLSDMAHYRLAMQDEKHLNETYTFQHVATQEVAYDTAASDQARDLHRSVALWYEQTYADHLAPHYPLLAFHWAGASDLVREFKYSQLAGIQAASQYANAEAEIYLSRALELGKKLQIESETLLEILQQRARVLAFLGHVNEERADLESLLADDLMSNNAARRGDILLLWSDFHYRCGGFEESLAMAGTAVAAMQEAGESIGEARARLQTGKALEGQGRFKESREQVVGAQRLLLESTALDVQAASAKMLGVISARIGELPTAMEQFNIARDLFCELDDRKGEADILGNLGALDYYLGEHERSLEYTEQAQKLFHEMGNRIGSAKCHANIGSSFCALGAFAEGLRHHEQALEIHEQLENLDGRADSLNNAGIAHMQLGVGGLTSRVHGELPELKESIECTSNALALYTEIRNQRGEQQCHANLGAAYLAIGDWRAAMLQLSQALALAQELGLDQPARRALSALARTDLLREAPESALVRSEHVMEQLGDKMPPDAAGLHYTHYRVLLANARKEEAENHLRIAHSAILERSKAIHNDDTRTKFLMMYQEVLAAWESRLKA
jgi:tetratricopeptide (TPR) repeat protein